MNHPGKDGTCQGCRKRTLVWFTLDPFGARFCADCWDEERHGTRGLA